MRLFGNFTVGMDKLTAPRARIAVVSKILGYSIDAEELCGGRVYSWQANESRQDRHWVTVLEY